MSEFKATEKQWAEMVFWSSKDSGGSACILELRNRIEKLELGAGIHAAVTQQIRNTYSGSLKEQALQALGRFHTNAHTTANQMMADFDLLRRAVEQLDD